MFAQIHALLRVAGVLEEMQVPYLVVGSVASSLHGFSRTTADVDIVADLQPENVAAPEDTILAKLQLHRRGGEVSERQLTDVLGALKVQRERLNLEYLREWAGRLEVSDLLERLLEEAGLGRV